MPAWARHGRYYHHHHYRVVQSHSAPQAQDSWFPFGFRSESRAGSSVVAEARKYLGTNPTGRRSDWCGAFMDLVLRRTGHPGGGNLARAYAQYGRRIPGPKVGAIAVMGRRGRASDGRPGGHVGVVAGIAPGGDPIIISGNHGHIVAEAVYPRGRIYAYVLPPH